ELAKNTITEQPPTSLIDKLSTNQYNTKINEQKSLDIQDKPDLTKLVTNDTDKEPLSQSLKLPGQPILNSHKESSKSALNARLNSNENSGLIQSTAPAENISSTKQNTANDTNSNNSLSSIEKAITSTELNSYKSTNNKAANTNTLFNSVENTNDNIPDFIKTQLAEKTSLAKAGINQTHQQGLTKINAENNESPNIVNSTINSREANVAKSFENTNIANNNSANIVEAAGPVNTSSENSFFNNQGADTSYEFQANPVNIKQNTESQKDFTNTLTQISDSSKPLGSLGNNVADNIIQNAKLYTQGGMSEVKIQLNPPELGNIKLEFAFDNDILETKITVERSAVKDVIEKDIPRLRELISNSDIDVGKLDVSLQEKENGRQDFMNKDFHSNSKNKSTQEFSNQQNEYYEDNADEETMANNSESTQINYLV
ncbi:MAG: flagellar hook-length control protein FliK, partial [Candidatus Scalindua sp.]